MGKLNVAIADDNEVMRDLLEEMVTSDDELHLRELCLKEFRKPSTMTGINRHDYIVEHRVAELGTEELLDECQVQTDAHAVLVPFAVVGNRREHADLVEVDLEIEASRAR